jgi:hypothetical protein
LKSEAMKNRLVDAKNRAEGIPFRILACRYHYK